MYVYVYVYVHVCVWVCVRVRAHMYMHGGRTTMQVCMQKIDDALKNFPHSKLPLMQVTQGKQSFSSQNNHH